MFSALVSSTLVATLAFHPYAVGRHATSPATTSATPPSETSSDEPPPSGWDDEPIPDAPAPAPAPTPTPAEVAPAPAPTPGTHEVVRPRTRAGIGLMVGAGVAGATAWGLAIGKMVLVTRCSDSIDNTMTTSDAEVTVFACFKDVQGIIGLSIAGWFANWATWGLAGGAGGVRGKHDGVGYAWDGKPDRVSGGFIGGGAAMLGVGVIGIGVTRILSLNILRCPVSTEEELSGLNRCLKHRFNGYFAGVQVSSTLVAAGLGMMIYGIVYRKNRQQFENRRVSDLRVVPDTSLFRNSGGGNYSGLALTGRF